MGTDIKGKAVLLNSYLVVNFLQGGGEVLSCNRQIKRGHNVETKKKKKQEKNESRKFLDVPK